ncbi:MAG: membrane protein insertase YidC [Casimicrobiaceae bacterium]
MDTQRLVLFIIFSFSALFLWEAWQREHRPPVPTVSTTPAAKSAPSAATDTPALPGAPAPPGVPAAAAPPGSGAAGGQRFAVRTDLFTAQVNTAGGVIEELALAKHRDATDAAKPYYPVLHTPERTLIAQSGLLGEGLPNHRTVFEVLPGPRDLTPGQDKLDVRLQATGRDGVKIIQTLTFHRGSYVIDVAYDVTNTTAQPISPYAYFQFTRDTKHQGGQSSMAPASYVGPVIYNEADKFKKVEFGDIDKLAADPTRKLPYTKTTDNGWVGMVEHYFVTAWLPSDEKKTGREFYTRKLDNGLYAAGVIVPVGTIAPGGTGEVRVPLYAGPQEQGVLAKLATGLDLVVDYGIFTVISAPLFWLLKWLHSIIHNWGWAIIVLTIIIKGVFYPLNHASARSMAKMKVIAPKMKALQAQYSNDKQQLQMKMMEMYKTEKINPLGGCLPIVVQIPVFIALYWVLLSAVELRHAPWVGWIQDLSAPDPWFVLPVIYAVTAYLQVRLSPTPIQDPMQAKIMQIMPIAFSVMFLFFPAGLVLYWLINNCLQIAQQWHMNRVLAREAEVAAARRR